MRRAILMTTCGVLVWGGCLAWSQGKRQKHEPESAVPRQIVAHIAKRLAEECRNLPASEIPDAASIMIVTPVVLSDAGEKGLLVRTTHECLCGGGNCLFQVWVEEKRGYERIFEDDGSDITLAPTGHAGRYDIVTEGHVAADKAQVVRYQWDGRKYVAADLMCRVGGEAGQRKVVPGPCQ
jgi:hypothetical protein